MNFTQAITSGFNRYADFTGRASRSEFWFWALFTWLASLVGSVFDVALFGYQFAAVASPISGVVSLALLVPSLAVGARRLHDIDRTGWWQLLGLTGIGFILLLVWWCLQGHAEARTDSGQIRSAPWLADPTAGGSIPPRRGRRTPAVSLLGGRRGLSRYRFSGFSSQRCATTASATDATSVTGTNSSIEPTAAFRHASATMLMTNGCAR